jgi:hypothetical protein
MLGKRFNEKRVGHILLIKEIMPIFNETPPITNKTLYRVTKDTNKDVVIGEEIGEYGTPIKRGILYNGERALTQNGTPIIAKDDKLNKIKQNNGFTKNGYKKGQSYTFSGMGYLENLKSDEIVICITDTLVILKSIESNNLSFYTYEELENIKSLNKVKVKR